MGHKEYYPRFGYRKAIDLGIEFPFEVSHEYCMVAELIPGHLLSKLCAIGYMAMEAKDNNVARAVIVEYLRYPFVEPNGNVRVTFDLQITSSGDFNAFLDRRIGGRPILPNGGGILEVKWDALVPEYLKQGLQMNSLQRISFSKYCLCRKYNVYGLSLIHI